jgi:hypothetical protein
MSSTKHKYEVRDLKNFKVKSKKLKPNLVKFQIMLENYDDFLNEFDELLLELLVFMLYEIL